MPEQSDSPVAQDFEPRIVAFFCNWCTYTAGDLAGTSRLTYSPNTRVIRVMCSGRIDPEFVFAALKQGADGVLIGGCHPGDCHYREGNYKALRRFKLIRRYLAQMGVEDERVRLEWIAASEGDRIQKVTNEMVAQIKRLGPLNLTRMPKVSAGGQPQVAEPVEPEAVGVRP
jgi:F420-non-reducing hydrogenase iron-sulfur subunit